ncbi:GH92 family glycosyl hydrolase [Aquimarina hainanensis]|uniref:GH92 family glycosyl hydrolase n=1 Tax=Aquimarina hainanensis TaxID=1578017 RepID=A0ABW5NF63_9FLAO
MSSEINRLIDSSVKYYSYIIYISICLCACQRNKKTVTPMPFTSFVNTFIGTDGPGNTYPGATVPFGMVQLSPDIGIPGWDRIAGYYYQDSIISGFSHMHLSGTGAGDLYDILIMPVNSRFSKRIKENNYKPFSVFSHASEAATPGYYTVQLKSYGIQAEMTATARTGIHRYTFPKDSASQLHIDLGYALNWDKAVDTYIKVVDDTTIEGYRISTGWAKEQRVYFVIKISKPFKKYTLYNDETTVKTHARGSNTKIVLTYETGEQEPILLKTGISTASIEGAYASINKEAPHNNFEQYKHEADSLWNKQLQKVHITTDDLDQKTIFYTMMYQSMLAPTLLSDHRGEYKGANGRVMQAKGYERYDTFSLWDTYRAAHPLYTLLHSDRVSDMVQSLVAHYQETGTLPVWSMQGNETNMMIGYHAVPVLVDAYLKGIESVDAELLLEACIQSAGDTTRQIPAYRKLGYVPISEENEDWSVSKTLEYAYDDWCIAQLAKSLQRENVYKTFTQRAENWKQLFDSVSRFMRPKYENGKFIEKFSPREYTPYFCESNAWQYFWSVPHDIETLIQTTGGKEAFEAKLDSLFTLKPLPEDKLPIFSTGMIGQYVHGNEPSHHVGYLYNYVGKPWKTQRIIRKILENQYKNEPAGHCGNEDCGQMSSWYVLSSLGFYPVNPAQGIYAMGTPLFDEAIVQLSDEKTFTIKTIDNSKENKYIQRMLLNGKEMDRLYLTHKEIMAGGEIICYMGPEPNKDIPKKMAVSSRVYK